MRAFFIGAAIVSLVGVAGCQSSGPVPGRQDVVEASVPPLPDGPASPDPSCSPAAPDC